jgi:multiple sugar transport system substrate-binding protein
MADPKRFGRRGRFIALPLLVLLLVLVVLIVQYRRRAVIIELSLYSGNSWGVPQNSAYAVYDRVVEMFEKKYADRNYRIVLKTGTMYKDYSEWFAQLVLKGREPDVFLILEEDFNTYAAIGLLEKLDPYIRASESFDTESFFAKALEAGRYRGDQYSLPISIVPSFLIVNTTLLHELGLTIDLDNWTWDQFLELCRAFTADTDHDGVPDRFGVEGYDWHQAFYTNDSNLFDASGEHAGFDDRRMVEMLEFLKNLYALNQGMIVTEGDFEKGHVGFKTFNFSEFRVYGSDPYRLLMYNNFDWEILPFPRGPHGRSASKLYTVQIGMSSRSRHKDAAFAFLEFISSDDDFQFEIWRYTNTLPVNRNAFNRIYHSDLMDSGRMKSIDKEFLEDVLAGSYIDPDFKKYALIDDSITQRIFKIVAQNENPVRGAADIREIINQYLTSDAGVKPAR